MAKDKEITFLFGSGISIDSGMPSVGAITESLINGNWYYWEKKEKSTTDIFIPSAEKHDIPEQKVLTAIRKRLEKYSKNINYEDIYSVLMQLWAYKKKSLINYATIDFLEKLDELIQHEYGACPWDQLDQVLALINTVVFYSLLSNEKHPIKGFRFLEQFKDEYRRIHAFTINHDLLLEKVLDGNFSDGFVLNAAEGYEEFKDSFDDSKQYHIYKLHGSIDWKNELYHSQKVVKLPPKDLLKDFVEFSKKHPRKVFLDYYPDILTGSLIKDLSYSIGIYPVLFSRFRNQLKSTNRLFVAGYGWGNFSLNNMITDWLLDSDKNKLFHFQRKKDSNGNPLSLPEKIDILKKSIIYKNKIEIVTDLWVGDDENADIKNYCESVQI